MIRIITATSFGFSVVSFLLWVFLVLKTSKGSPAKAETMAGAEPHGINDMARVIEALAKLTDSFAKAGPMVMALVAAVFFLMVAVMGSGLEAAATN